MVSNKQLNFQILISLQFIGGVRDIKKLEIIILRVITITKIRLNADVIQKIVDKNPHYTLKMIADIIGNVTNVTVSNILKKSCPYKERDENKRDRFKKE